MFYLYGTSHCHLCDEAEAILLKIKPVKSITWEIIDIAHDDTLIALYGLKIPVLKSLATHKELCWPFDSVAVELFIANNMHGN